MTGYTVICLLQVDEGQGQGPPTRSGRLEDVCEEKLVVLDAVGGAEPSLLRGMPALLLCHILESLGEH